MTCIVGYVTGDKRVLIGGDSAAVSGWQVQKKVFIKNDMAFGFTSSFRMGQILRHCFSIPPHYTKLETMDYLCGPFIDSLITCYESKGYAKKVNEVKSGGHFLLGYKGALYCVESDYQVTQLASNYAATGCGESYALGAFQAMEGLKIRPGRKVIKALESAAHLSGAVIAPFHVVELTNKETKDES